MKRLLFGLIISFYYYNISAQEISQAIDTIFLKLSDTIKLAETFFSHDSVFKCTLKCDLKSYQRTKNNEKYICAEFIYRKDNHTIYNKIVRIKARGINRRELCSLPPFWLSMQRKHTKNHRYKVHQKFKVVSHCSYQRIYESYIFKEYLIYKMYNLLTPFSFKVRLAQITYIDTGRKLKTSEQFAIFIEPMEELTRRLKVMEVKNNQYGIYYTEEKSTDLLCMFAYMTGNTDWSVAGRHNIKLVHKDQQLIPIPYDFDYTGLVNTHYAIPREGFGLTNVRERAYFGPCRELLNYTIAAQQIKNKKIEFHHLIESFELLDSSNKKDMHFYLNEFYKNIERPDFIKYHIVPNCYEPEDFN